jgi:hypothetical protein
MTNHSRSCWLNFIITPLARLAERSTGRDESRPYQREKATVEHEGAGAASSRRLVIQLPKVHWTQILAISIFWFALNFHWTALGIIILPSQVFKMVSDAHKSEVE